MGEVFESVSMVMSVYVSVVMQKFILASRSGWFPQTLLRPAQIHGASFTKFHLLNYSGIVAKGLFFPNEPLPPGLRRGSFFMRVKIFFSFFLKEVRMF